MFDKLGLDARILQALRQLNYSEPTLVQQKAIPLALQDRKDIVARAKTGSGKTAAYIIPVVQSILEDNESDSKNRALILVPSRELADQVSKVVKQMTMYCDKVASSVNIAQQVNDQVQASLLADSPSIIIATPAKAIDHIQKGNIDAKSLKYLVIDEADLVLSFGYEDDLTGLAEVLPVKKTLQTWLMSATLSEEVEQLKSIFCRNTAILKLEDDEQDDSGKLVQYYAKCSEFDKYLLAYVIFKLNLIKGKTIIFVNDVDRCYRLKLFLEQFGIKAATLNAELPVASRLHIVDQFNKNIYNLVIATDEASVVNTGEEEDEQETGVKNENEDSNNNNNGNDNELNKKVKNQQQSSKKDKRQKRKDKEYGVSRGVDFQNVACVLNFDLPTSSRAYTHRIGRTARANKSGMSLSFVVPKEEWGKHRASSLESAKRDEKILQRIIKSQAKSELELQPYQFDMKQVESFRYRMEDAFRAVTKIAVREARDREFRQELLASEKLTRHFEENPEDLVGLRHDKTLSHPTRVQPHLKRVPDYLLPSSSSTKKADIGFVAFKKGTENRVRRIRKVRSGRSTGSRKDPLKSFKPGNIKKR